MSDTRYRKGKAHAADMAVYVRDMAEDNSSQMGRVKRNLMRAMREDITPRQRQCMTLYYQHGFNTSEIAQALGLDKSTVARTIRRGEARLRRCLRYGAEVFFKEPED